MKRQRREPPRGRYQQGAQGSYSTDEYSEEAPDDRRREDTAREQPQPACGPRRGVLSVARLFDLSRAAAPLFGLLRRTLGALRRVLRVRRLYQEREAQGPDCTR